MPTKAQPVRVGPFTGGLNTYSDPSTIGDTECSDILNFDINLDGSLISRPPVTVLPGMNALGFRILGYFTWTDKVAYIICSTNAGTYAYNTVTNVWITITTTFAATSFVQYANIAWLISPSSNVNPSGQWTPTVAFAGVASMAHGSTAVVYKERLYVGSGDGSVTPSRLQFSLPGNFAGVWVGTDFIDINSGDGQNIIELIGFNGAIIVFKRNSTYMFAYDSTPAKGAVQIIATNIGLTGKDCIEIFENEIYIMYSEDVYKISNWNWEQINVKVPFFYVNTHIGTTTVDYSLSIIGNRLICKYFDTYYVFGFKTKAWSKWSFINSDPQIFPTKFWKYPTTDPLTGIDKYFAASALIAVDVNKSLQVLLDTHTSTAIESMTVFIRSKVYDFNSPYSYKKLAWWGSDLKASSIVNATIIDTAVTLNTWQQLSAITWQYYSNYAWNAPQSIQFNVNDSANVRSIIGTRMFVKWLKAIRFRQIAFELSSVVDGSTNTGPFRLFSVTAFVSSKQTVNNKIN